MEEGQEMKHRSEVAKERYDEGGCMEKERVRTIVINMGIESEKEA